MSATRRAAIELTLAVLAVAGCVLSWLNAATAVDVAPVIDGEPATTSVAYYPPLLVLSLLCATAAGVLAVIGVTRLRRHRQPQHV